jgi:phage shock protein A
MKELTRTQMAVVKRTAQNVKGLRTKLAKINEKVEALTAEAIEIDNTIEQFEAPIRTMTGGFSSEEVLNGTMDAITEQIEEMSKESHCCDCPIEENVNEAPVASNEIPYI